MYELALIVGLLAVVLLFIIVILVSVNGSLHAQIRTLSNAIEQANRAHKRFQIETEGRLEQAQEDLKLETARVISEQLKLLQDKTRDMEIEFDTQSLRFDRLEERINEYLSVAPTTLDTARVVALHNAGLSTAEIAKEIRANHSEVQFALSIHNLDAGR